MSRTEPFHFETMRTARLVIGLAVLFVIGSVALVPLLLARGVYGVAAAVGVMATTLIVAGAAVVKSDDAGIFFELTMRRRFRRVCQQKGLTTSDDNGRVTFPAYARLIGSSQAFHFRIRPLIGQSLGDWERAAAAFSLAFGSLSVRFDEVGDGMLSMKVGTQRLVSQTLAAALDVVADEHVLSWREQLRSVVIGQDEHGQPYALPLIDSHVLIAGITGSGKGSIIWSSLLRLVPYMKAGVVQVWGFDPKHMELSLGRSFFGDRYAADPDDMVTMLERAHDEMKRRAAKYAGIARKFEPSPLMPLHVLYIDELGYLSALLQDRKQQQRVERALSGILVLGRAVGFVVIGALQDPRKSTLDFRDLFPTRVAMRLPKGMVDLVLGSGMYELGAHCDLIPAGEDGAGVCFVLSETSTVPQCIRASWVSDELIISAAKGFELPPGETFRKAI